MNPVGLMQRIHGGAGRLWWTSGRLLEGRHDFALSTRVLECRFMHATVRAVGLTYQNILINMATMTSPNGSGVFVLNISTEIDWRSS